MRARMACAGLSGTVAIGLVLGACGDSTSNTQASCTSVYAVGDTVNGALRSTDCRFQDGSYVEYYRFDATATTSLRFTMTSDSFATFLLLTDAVKNPLAGNGDDGTGGNNSALHVLLATGRYHVAANSFNPNAFGPYTLASAIVPAAVDNCEDVWVTRGISTTQAIANTDCVSNTNFYADGFLVLLQQGQSITATETSTAFNAYLQLVRLTTMGVVAFDNDGGGGTNAQLTYTAPVADAYVLFAETFNAGETGAYTLTIPVPPSLQAVGRDEDTPDTPTISRLDLARIKQLRGRRVASGGLIRDLLTRPNFVASSQRARAQAKKEQRSRQPQSDQP